MMDTFKKKLERIGKPHWQPLLIHIADLHMASLHSPFFKIPYQWEEIALGGNLGLVFGHWDTVHMALDMLFFEPQHAMHQIMNCLALQQPNGFIPGSISLVNNELHWSSYTTFPPLWPIVVQEYINHTHQQNFLKNCFESLKKQISWFESHRQVAQGFYYIDCLDHVWESGGEESLRFDFDCDVNEAICVDATAHLFSLYKHAASWAKILEEDPSEWQKKAQQLSQFIQSHLFDDETGFFYDFWSISNSEKRLLAFEGIWPLVTGAATTEQAQRVINENLLEPSRFFTAHPIPSVGINDPRFEYCHWRGPTRNSMTYWAARGCLHYNRADAALILLERALDATAKQFLQTGSLWEFYHPKGGDQRELSRQQGIHPSPPFTNHLGHNPLLAMAYLWETAGKSKPLFNNM